mmetsp:Transcript_27271/g.88083  ORF Transcript_27271/g.88083 Transcript_27271/m.88083 type:complete len:102 (+) Transcript_27271:919-1224(+)
MGLTQPLRDRLQHASAVLGIQPQQIFVRDVNGKSRSILANLSQTVKTFLAVTVSDLPPITSACHYYMVSQGRNMSADQPLEDQGVAKGSTVHIRIGCSGKQ